jgi:hypothetical protein
MKKIKNAVIMFIVWLSQKIAIYKLKSKKIKNKKLIYFKNKYFQEEVWLDDDFKPHFLSIQFKGINIDYGRNFINWESDNVLSKNEREMNKINKQINETKEKMNDHKFPIKIEIKREKDDNSS